MTGTDVTTPGLTPPRRPVAAVSLAACAPRDKQPPLPARVSPSSGIRLARHDQPRTSISSGE